MSLRTLSAILIMVALLPAACSKQETSSSASREPTQPKLAVKYETPPSLEVPAIMEPQSDTDWKAIANNKNAEIVELLNIINPVAAYITAAFNQYSDKLSALTHEEWEDTRAQLAKATAMYEDCKKRMDSGKFDKKLFLDLEDTWQVFVKVGVAGVRTKTMVEADLNRAS